MRLTKTIKEDMHHALMVHSGLYDEKSMKEQALKEQGDVCYHKALARYLDMKYGQMPFQYSLSFINPKVVY